MAVKRDRPRRAEPAEALLNVEAEQAVIGACLLNNEIIDAVAGIVTPDDFADPIHAEAFGWIIGLRAEGKLVSPITLPPYLDGLPGFADLGGKAYLWRLSGAAVLSAAPDIARTLADLGRKRRLADKLAGSIEDLHRADTTDADVLGGIDAFVAKTEAPAASGTLMRLALDTIQSITAVRNAEGATAGVGTGIRELDKIIGGLSPSQLIILGGRPGMGKSTIALQIALNVARRGIGVFFDSHEMSGEELMQRILSESAALRNWRIPYAKIRRAEALNDAEMHTLIACAQDVGSLPLHVNDVGPHDLTRTASDLRAFQRRLERRGQKVGLVVVDYLQLVKTRLRDSRNEEVSEISVGLKALAKATKLPVIALSQLSRGVESREDKRPMLSDLRDSGAIEQDADLVAFAFRESYYHDKAEPPAGASSDKIAAWHSKAERVRGKVEIIVAKQRMGPVGTAHLLIDEATNRVFDPPEFTDHVEGFDA